MTAWCKIIQLPFVIMNTNYLLQDLKDGGHVGRAPHQLSARGVLRLHHQWLSQADSDQTCNSSGVGHWELARGRTRSDSLPRGELLEHKHVPLLWTAVGGSRGLSCSRSSTSENAKSLLFPEAEQGDSLAGCGNLGVHIRAINPHLGPLSTAVEDQLHGSDSFC